MDTGGNEWSGPHHRRPFGLPRSAPDGERVSVANFFLDTAPLSPPAGAASRELARSLAEVYTQALAILGKLARRRGIPAQDAQDVVHTALLHALGKAHAYDPERPLLPWLTGIAEHSIQEWRAGRLRLRQPRTSTEDPDRCPEGCRWNHDPAEQAARRDEDEWLTGKLAALPEKYMSSLKARYVLGLRTKEIAARAGRSEKAIERELSRALIRLRGEVQRYTAQPASSSAEEDS